MSYASKTAKKIYFLQRSYAVTQLHSVIRFFNVWAGRGWYIYNIYYITI